MGIGKIKKQVTKLIYCNGKQVIIRDLQNPLDTWMYEEHKHETTVARIAPSGFYIASADVSGRILIWDCAGEDKVIKLEKQSIGAIADMAFSDDSKRIIVGGNGREKFGEAFFVDGGASVGEISGHTKQITSLDLKQTRPFRLITGSEDFLLGWFEGPPFKFKKSVSEHTRYVNCVRFSPDGNKIISVGSDKKGLLLDGKEGTKLGELSATGAHGGSIFGAAWSPDGSKIATASADKTVKVWDQNGGLLHTYSCFGNDVNDQQLGCLWQDGMIVSVALSGTIYYLDENNTSAPKKALLGHNKLITALAYDSKAQRAFTADSTGYVIEWNTSNGEARTFKGAAHTSQVKGLTTNNGKLISISIDDSIKFSSLDSLDYGESIALGGQPVAVSAQKEITAVATSAGIVILNGHQITLKHNISFSASAIALSPDTTHLAVGAKEGQIYVYTLNGGALKQEYVLEEHRGEITTLAYSHDGKYLGAGDGNREVKVWEGKTSKVSQWVFHTSRVQSLSWAPDNIHLATGSVDSSVIVWNVSQPDKRIILKLAHLGGVRGVAFQDENTVLSVGEDCAMKSWALTY